jgi:hypothetical protein
MNKVTTTPELTYLHKKILSKHSDILRLPHPNVVTPEHLDAAFYKPKMVKESWLELLQQIGYRLKNSDCPLTAQMWLCA